MLGLDFGGIGQAGAERGHDFHALDGVDAEVGVQAHVEIEHLGGVAGFFSDHGKDGGGDGRGVGGGGCSRGLYPTLSCGGGEGGGSVRSQERDDLLKSLKRAEVLGFDFGRAGELGAQRRHDFDTFDGVHAKVGVQAHVEIQHLDGVASFLGDDGEQRAGGGGGVETRGSAGLWPGDCGDGFFARGGRLALRRHGKELHDLLERLERAEVLGLHFGRIGQASAQRGHDFDALDGIDAEVGVEPHVEIEHLDGITSFFGDDG